MLKNINLDKVLKAMAIAFSFIFVTNIMADGKTLFTQNFLISLLIYSTLTYSFSSLAVFTIFILGYFIKLIFL